MFEQVYVLYACGRRCIIVHCVVRHRCVSVSVCGECHGVLCNIRFRGCFHSSVRPWGVVCSEACVACDGGIAQW